MAVWNTENGCAPETFMPFMKKGEIECFRLVKHCKNKGRRKHVMSIQGKWVPNGNWKEEEHILIISLANLHCNRYNRYQGTAYIFNTNYNIEFGKSRWGGDFILHASNEIEYTKWQDEFKIWRTLYANRTGCNEYAFFKREINT